MGDLGTLWNAFRNVSVVSCRIDELSNQLGQLRAVEFSKNEFSGGAGRQGCLRGCLRGCLGLGALQDFVSCELLLFARASLRYCGPTLLIYAWLSLGVTEGIGFREKFDVLFFYILTLSCFGHRESLKIDFGGLMLNHLTLCVESKSFERSGGHLLRFAPVMLGWWASVTLCTCPAWVVSICYALRLSCLGGGHLLRFAPVMLGWWAFVMLCTCGGHLLRFPPVTLGLVTTDAWAPVTLCSGHH